MTAPAAHLRFALALHAAVARPGAASCVSPYSVASALALVASAARGRTLDELRALIGEPAEVHELAEAAAQLPGDGPDAPVIAVSNTLWAAAELPIRPQFVEALGRRPGAAVRTAPFAEDPAGARELINADVRDATRELIPELIPPGVIDADTVAALVNALYLAVGWRHRFDAPAPAPFRAPSGTRTVPTMRLSERLRYARHSGWQAVALPGAGGVEALVLLPDAELAVAEAALDEPALGAVVAALRPVQVRLAMPTVDLDVASPLTAALQALGVRTVFTPDADLGGLSPDPRLRVSAVLHQAVLRLDEQGLEGAAATAVVMVRTSAVVGGDPVVMTVDRPFLLLVRHVGSGAVYFLARVTEPAPTVRG